MYFILVLHDFHSILIGAKEAKFVGSLRTPPTRLIKMSQSAQFGAPW